MTTAGDDFVCDMVLTIRNRAVSFLRTRDLSQRAEGGGSPPARFVLR
jgi:hypothetical protein